MFAPKLCKKSAAIWTLSVGILILVSWVFIPQTHIVSHPIYLEWPLCLVTFFLVYIFDKRPATISTSGNTSTSTATLEN